MVVNNQVYRGGTVLKDSLNFVPTGLVFTRWLAVCLVSSMCCWLKLVSRMILSWKWKRLTMTSLVRSRPFMPYIHCTNRVADPSRIIVTQYV